MSEFLSGDNLALLLTLTGLEIVLGIDNIVFVAILVAKLDPAKQAGARRLGLIMAMLMRIALLLGVTWLMRLTKPLFGVLGHDFSGKDLIMLVGGLFLVAKATYEIHDKLEGATEHESKRGYASMAGVITQIMLLDMVFSLDSVITAVGMAEKGLEQLPIMIAAVVASVIVMLVFAGPVGNFVNRHPTMKVLALSFLILIGVTLVAEGFGKHIEKGYIYFAMAFSLGIELLNMWMRKKQKPVELHQTYVEEPPELKPAEEALG